MSEAESLDSIAKSLHRLITDGYLGRIANALEARNSLDRIEGKLDTLIQGDTHMAGELDALTASVAKIKGKIDSLEVLTKGLADFIRANVGNGPALLAMAADLDAKSGEIQAAIDANPLPGDGGPPPPPA